MAQDQTTALREVSNALKATVRENGDLQTAKLSLKLLGAAAIQRETGIGQAAALALADELIGAQLSAQEAEADRRGYRLDPRDYADALLASRDGAAEFCAAQAKAMQSRAKSKRLASKEAASGVTRK